MRIAILQPGYIPWLGFFEQMHKCDIFVLYDDVQYDKHGWRNRNRIKTANGIQWLTVPVSVSLSEPTIVREVRIDNSTNWRKKHLQSIRQNYSKARFYRDHIGLFEEALTAEWELLVDLDIYFIEKLATMLGISTRMVRSSELDIPRGDKVERLVGICRIFNADTFYEGAAGRDYIDTDVFARQGVGVEFQDYVHPVYQQLYGQFVPYLSIIDLLFNHGDESLSILTGTRREVVS